MAQIDSKSFKEIQNELCEDLDDILKHKENYIPNKKKEIKQNMLFKCRLCGNTKYKGVYGDSSLIPLGGTQYPISYQCSNCSIMFKDPEKFTKKE